MEDLSSRSGQDPLKPLKANYDCQIWSKPERPGKAELQSALEGCHGLLCLITDRIDSDLIQSCSELRVISSCSVGVDHIDREAASTRGIPIGHTPGVLTETTADLTFALMLAAARRVAEGDTFVRSGGWKSDPNWGLASFVGVDVFGSTLGIIGLGGIGRAVARRAAGFGMRVMGWSRTPGPVAGVERVELPELLNQSDFVSINIALASETRGLIDREAISRMKPGSVLVNTARGGIVDDQALAQALAEGRLAAAGLDVFAGEPIGPEHPLAALDNVVMTPHIGSASLKTRMRMAELSVENCMAGLEGRPLLRCANQADLG
ncbi:MAG: D-glycerate dehydrogenase [Deltaproteobacteria bacterium]|nr:D-glycerate dehydrogenase [Deltaproteobacteria bacterium]